MIGKQVRLTEAQDQKLRLLAKLRHSSQSKIVRDAIDRLPEEEAETIEGAETKSTT
jgi:predicted transcriptional regulator